MRIAVILLIVALTAGIGIKRFIFYRNGRELAVYAALLTLAAVIAVAGIMGIELPNPNNYLAKIFGPLNQALRDFSGALPDD